jgi:uncharacterized protein YjbI with pentapeptide repeats
MILTLGKVQFRAVEGCKITNSDITKADFYDTHFKNCTFFEVNFSSTNFDECEFYASHFYNCEFDFSDFENSKFHRTTFLKNNLSSTTVTNVKVWKLNEWVEMEDFSSFQNHLDE